LFVAADGSVGKATPLEFEILQKKATWISVVGQMKA
jgi:hypothetical protein